MSERQQEVLEKLGKVLEKLDEKGLETILNIGDGIAIGIGLGKKVQESKSEQQEKR